VVRRMEHLGLSVNDDAVAIFALNRHVAQGFEEGEDLRPFDVGSQRVPGEVVQGMPLTTVQVVLLVHVWLISFTRGPRYYRSTHDSPRAAPDSPRATDFTSLSAESPRQVPDVFLCLFEKGPKGFGDIG
jgi:hypothetical protein